MIQNLPNPEIFLKLSIENLDFSIHLIEDLLINEEYIEYEEIDYEINKKTSIVLLFQGIENFLKYEISKISPLLLISDNINNIKNKNFNEVYLHGFNELLSIYENIIGQEVSSYKIDELRKIRNNIVHGLYDEIIEIKNIVKWIYLFYSSIGETINWTPLHENIEKNSNSDEIGGVVYRKGDLIDAFQSYLTKKEFQHLFKINTKIRDELFYCSLCFRIHFEWLTDSIQDITKTSYLKDTNTLFCICCNNSFSLNLSKCSSCGEKKYLIYDSQCEKCLEDY